MATTITEGEPRESRTSSAASMRWQRKLATFAECQLNGFANNRAVELDTASGREGSWPRVCLFLQDCHDESGDGLAKSVRIRMSSVLSYRPDR
jgi:hypothetical protein